MKTGVDIWESNKNKTSIIRRMINWDRSCFKMTEIQKMMTVILDTKRTVQVR